MKAARVIDKNEIVIEEIDKPVPDEKQEYIS